MMTSRRGPVDDDAAPPFAAMIESITLRSASAWRRAWVIESRVLAAANRLRTISAMRTESSCVRTGLGGGVFGGATIAGAPPDCAGLIGAVGAVGAGLIAARAAAAESGFG